MFALPVTAQESIRSYDVKIVLTERATLEVVETIKYDFGNESHHGIFRDIPTRYTINNATYKLRITDITVTDEGGRPQTFKIERAGANTRIKIGDPNVYVTGLQAYKIYYTVDRAVEYFKDFDQLYWNVIGHNWSVPINNVTSRIIVPGGSTPEQLRAECFMGPLGSTITCPHYSWGKVKETVAELDSTQGYMEPGSGITIRIRFPKGILYEPSIAEKIVNFARDNAILLLPVMVLIGMLFLWRRHGKDPAGKGTVISQYEAPDNLTPLEVGTLIDQSAQGRDISADIINLAVKGYLKISEVEGSNIFGKKDYLLTKLKHVDTALSPAEQKLLNGLFVRATLDANGNSLGSVKLSELKKHFYKTFQEIANDTYTSLTKKGYFTAHPNKVRAGYLIAGCLIAVAGIWGSKMFPSAVWVGSFIASGVVVIVIGLFMPKRTHQGVLAREHILGLKEYLRVAEKDRLKFHNAPEKKPEVFEKLLPYAMVLGVEKEWAGQFRDIYTAEPRWYHSGSGSGFNSVVFASSLHNFSAQANRSLAVSPSSGRGGSGGGFSGGGFGGGGGGSW